MKLTMKQKKFADKYLETGNITQSAVDAGYSKKTARVIGQENLLKPAVRSYIDEQMGKVENDHIMTVEEAVMFLTNVATGKEKETVVVATPTGAQKVTKEADIKTRISAVKELLKRYPDNDKVMEQQLRKLTAEADLAEARAKEFVEDTSDYNEVQLVFTDRTKKGQDDAD